MSQSRRSFLGKGGKLAATGALSVLAVGCSQPTDADAAEECAKPSAAPCGLSCAVCPMMKAGKCKGCAAKAKMAKDKGMKACAIVECVTMKKIDHCGTGCKMFTKCKKLVGHPYAQSYMDMMDKKLGDS